MSRLCIESEGLVLYAELNDSESAQKLEEILPVEGRASFWGEEIYFGIPLYIDQSAEARDEVEVGAIAYWPPGNAFCLFWGATPASRGGEPRAASPVNVLGKIEGDASRLARIPPGARIRLSRA